MNMPDEFASTDPVTKSKWNFSMTTFGSTPRVERATYLKAVEDVEGYQRVDHSMPDMARALIQYGVDIEMARVLKILEGYRKDLEYDPEVDLVREIMDELNREDKGS